MRRARGDRPRPGADAPSGPDREEAVEAPREASGDEVGEEAEELEEDGPPLEVDADEDRDVDEAGAPSGRPALSIYLRELSRIPLLKREEEIALAKRVAAGDESAERQMVEANLRLVVMIARRYANRGLPLPDLIAEGNLGLLRAVQKYRWERGTRFSTYATWWIRQAVVRALANQARLVRLPVHVEQQLGRYRRSKDRLTQQLGRPPEPAEIAADLKVPVEDLAGLDDLGRIPVSLETPVGGGEGVLEDVMADTGGPDAMAIAAVFRERDDLRELLGSLPTVERDVLADRFGFGGNSPMTLEAIGRRMGVSRERVRQIEAGALRKLRARLEARGVDWPGA